MAQELATFRTALAIAVLRGTDCPIVPEEHLAESLSSKRKLPKLFLIKAELLVQHLCFEFSIASSS